MYEIQIPENQKPESTVKPENELNPDLAKFSRPLTLHR